MGYVYYGHYLDYFEVARTEMIREAGFPYTRLEKEGIILPVIYSQIAYHQPVFYDELMNIEVLVFEIPVVRLETYYRIFTERQEAPHAEGQVTLCFTDAETRKPKRAPKDFVQFLEKSQHR